MIKKRICHITSVHPRYDVRIFLKECISLAKEYEVHLIVADGKGNEFIDGVNIHDCGLLGSRKRRILIASKVLYNKAKMIDAEIYHFHDPELIPLGVRLKKTGKKVIYDVHEDVSSDILTKKWIPGIFRKSISVAFNYYQKNAAKKLDYIITATPHIESQFKEYNRALAINNYPNIKEDSKINYEDKTANKICYAGVISIRRGINEMIDAVKDLPVEFDLAGSFYNEATYKDMISRPGWEKLRYHGMLNHLEAKELRMKSKIGLLLFHPGPNHTDSQPNKLFEYMEASLAIICSDFPLWRDVVEKNNCGICVDPFNVDAVKKAIGRLINDPELCKVMGTNGRNMVLNRYNWAVEEKKLFELYNNVIS